MPQRRMPYTAGLAALLGVIALLIPSRCEVNEIGHHHARHVGDLVLGPAPRAEQRARFDAACGVPGDTAPEVLRSPYLQLVTPSSAAILWTAIEPEGLAVIRWRAGAAGAPATTLATIDRSAILPRGSQLVAELDQLTPSTTYCYEVRSGAERLAGPFGFTTAPPVGVGAPIRLVAFGDMGYRTADQSAVLEQMRRVEFDLVLLAGDIAYPDGMLEEYERNLFDVYQDLMRTAPFYPASGNHDYRTDDAGPFRQVFAMPLNGAPAGVERWYSFDWGDLHVVVLDSEILGEPQERWLEADLKKTRAPWTIAMFHKPPYSSARGVDLPTKASLEPILLRHRVPLVLSGHEHHYERFHPVQGTTFIITGGGGRGTRRVAHTPESAIAEQVAHFVYITVAGDDLKLWAIDASGQTFDTLQLRRAPVLRSGQ